MSNCTIVVNATGARCGQPAVKTWESSIFPGEILGECRKHHFDFEPHGRNIGDLVEVRRHGKDYIGQVVRVTPTKVFAQVTYGNGATRVVEV